MPRGTSRYDEARLQGRLWTPQQWDSSKLFCWYDAADFGAVLSPATTSMTWKDKSGNGRDLSTGGVNTGPAYSATAMIGGRPAVGGFVNAEIATSTNFGVASNKWNALAVCQFTTNDAYMRIIGLCAAFGGNDALGASTCYALLLRTQTPVGADGVQSFWNSNQSLATFSGGYSPTTAHVCVSTNDGVNNVCYADGVGGTPFAFNQTITPGALQVGATLASQPAVNGANTGFIGEVMIYVGLLSATDRQRCEGFLAWKWGLVGNLVASHPYKNRPPLIGV